MLKEALGGGLVASLLYQHVEFYAVLVGGTPQQMRRGAPRSAANISSRCYVRPGLRCTAVAHVGKPASNFSHQQRIVCYVTTMSRGLRLNRKYQRTAQLMTTEGKRWP